LQEIKPQTLVIANYEIFSSGTKQLQVLGSKEYPVESWTLLGNLVAEEKLGEQIFDINKANEWVRFVKIRFLSHYGDEHYCTLTSLGVHGVNQVEDLQQTLDGVKEPDEQVEEDETVSSDAADMSALEEPAIVTEEAAIVTEEPVVIAEKAVPTSVEDEQVPAEAALKNPEISPEANSEGLNEYIIKPRLLSEVHQVSSETVTEQANQNKPAIPATETKHVEAGQPRVQGASDSQAEPANSIAAKSNNETVVEVTSLGAGVDTPSSETPTDDQTYDNKTEKNDAQQPASLLSQIVGGVRSMLGQGDKNESIKLSEVEKNGNATKPQEEAATEVIRLLTAPLLCCVLL